MFQSRVDPGSPDFAENRRGMLALLDDLAALKKRAEDQSEKRRPRFAERGQLTPRQRLARLLDPGMPWLELYGLANYCVSDPSRETSVPGASILAGIGYVRGTRCMICASDSGIAAGAMTPMSGPKLSACMDMAREKKMPFLHLIESAGANLMKYAVEGWAHGGGIFARLARRGVRISPGFRTM